MVRYGNDGFALPPLCMPVQTPAVTAAQEECPLDDPQWMRLLSN